MKKELKTQVNSLFLKLLYLGAIGFCVLLVTFFTICTWIGFDVRDKCNKAISKYNDGCVTSLISTLNDESNGFKERNSAIWALGQLGDEKALPVLEKYYTGVIPAREPLDKVISQYELKKAINLASGGFNISAIVWRGGR